MKKVLLVMAAIACLVATPSCKKGANDPGLSLKSRKARLAGDNAIESWISSITTIYNNNDKVETNRNITGNSGTITTINTPDGEGSTTSVRNVTVNSSAFDIDKDGTWTMTFNTTTSWTNPGDGFLVDSYDYTQVEMLTESGNWSFLGGETDEFKNKERVLFSILNSATSSQLTTVTNFDDGSSDTDANNTVSQSNVNANGEVSSIYEIDMLKKDEIRLVKDLAGGYSYDDEVYTYSLASTGSAEILLMEK